VLINKSSFDLAENAAEALRDLSSSFFMLVSRPKS
jgi:hypothetical protein